MATASRPARYLWLVRHAETEWSRDGRHTSRTDLPLTSDGERMAVALGRIMQGRSFSAVWSSPRTRALRTCELIGLSSPTIDDDLREWDYGEYEGLTSAEISQKRPGWNLWRHGCPGGETISQVSRRAHRAVARALEALGSLRAPTANAAPDAPTTAPTSTPNVAPGHRPESHTSEMSPMGEVNIAIISHGHFLRAFVAAWLELPASRGRSFGMHSDSVSILGFEHQDRVVWSWDWTEHLFASGH